MAYKLYNNRRRYRVKRQNGRIRPKFTFEGQLGAGVPFLGGSKFKFGTRQKKQIAAIAKRQIGRAHV